jgi:hypothetical protein
VEQLAPQLAGQLVLLAQLALLAFPLAALDQQLVYLRFDRPLIKFTSLQ